jgi:hypothetical protein
MIAFVRGKELGAVTISKKVFRTFLAAVPGSSLLAAASNAFRPVATAGAGHWKRPSSMAMSRYEKEVSSDLQDSDHAMALPHGESLRFFDRHSNIAAKYYRQPRILRLPAGPYCF